MPNRNDEELFETWRNGDSRAGEILFERYFPSVLRFFRNKVSDGVEDLVQETFLACVRAKDGFRGESLFRTYLFQAARSKLYTYLSKRQRDHDHLDFGRSSVADLNVSPPTLMIQKAEMHLLAKSLQQLPVDIQITLELFYFETMSGSQIADIFGISEGTVRSRLRRGKELLRERMEKNASHRALFQSTAQNLESWANQIRTSISKTAPSRNTSAEESQ